MKIIIEGEPKEIADLILAVQGKLEKRTFMPEASNGFKGLKSNTIHPKCDHYHPNQIDVERG